MGSGGDDGSGGPAPHGGVPDKASAGVNDVVDESALEEEMRRQLALRKNCAPCGGRGGAMGVVHPAKLVHDAPLPPRAPPVSAAELRRDGLLAADGSVADPSRLLKRVYAGGLAKDARREIWPRLLGIVPWDATAAQQRKLRAERTREYNKALRLWTAHDRRGALIACTAGAVAQYSRIIDVDVPRTDRQLERWKAPESLEPVRRLLLSHCAVDARLGYMQGMNDLAAVVLDAMEGDEADSFACFRALLHRIEINFEERQLGVWRQTSALLAVLQEIDPRMHKALTAAGAVAEGGECVFLFQPIFLVLKRELASYEDVCHAWEQWWAASGPHAYDGACAHFQVLLVIAFLETRRAEVLQNRSGVPGLLQIVNAAPGTLSCAELLSRAHCVHDVLRPHAKRIGTAAHAIFTSERLVSGQDAHNGHHAALA